MSIRPSSPAPEPPISPFRAHLSRPGPTTAPRVRTGLAVAALAGALLRGAAPGAAQEPSPETQELRVPCPRGRVGYVFVDNHSIFDAEELDEERSFRWAYELANSLHMKTRAGFIEDELLFEVGDCLDPLILEESARILRTYDFIARADVYAVDQLDGTHHVVVDTQDEWTTQVDLRVRFDGGLRLEGLDVTEKNFLGRGIRLGGFFREDRERRDLGAELGFPRFLGTRTDVTLSGGRTRAGGFFAQSVEYPFVGEVGRVALRQSYEGRDELFSYATDPGREFSHLLLPVEDQSFELAVAGRVGAPGNLTLFGLGVTHTDLAYPMFPETVELVRDGDFGAGEPASPEVASALAGQAVPTRHTRLNFLLGQRNLRFERVRGLDPLAGEQDVRLGTDLGLTIGRTVGGLGDAPASGSDDLFGRIRLYLGAAAGSSYVFANVGAQGRQIFSAAEGEDGWRDVVGEVDVFAYLRTGELPGNTLVARVSADGGWVTSVPFQITLGGRHAVRGWHEDDFPGARRVVASLEDRIFLDWPAPDFMDFGLSVFADVGRVWPGGVPFGTDSGWRTAVGAGLRLGFPAGSRGVLRADLAWPLTQDNTRGPIFRVSLVEILGLASGFFHPQIQRSRRVTLGPDSFVQEIR